MDGVIAYILSKKYTNDTAIGMGAVKGAPCQVESINKVNKTTTITLKWEDNLGASHTQSFDIEDGLDGVSIVGATINSTGNLILTLSDTTTIDCGKVLPQYNIMPTPSSAYLGAIYQYIGNTTVQYTNGYFYKCVSNGSGGYTWEQHDVQPTPVISVNGKVGGVILDANDVNAQEIIQYSIMPTADSTNLNKIYQYIGETDSTYTNGYFYRCEYDTDTGTYSWVVANQFALADDVYTKTEIGTLSNLPDINKDVIENIADLNTAINGKEDKFRVTLLPLGSDDLVGKIVQYIGENTSSLVKGYYYQCVKIAEGVYNWVQKNVQPSSGGTGGDGVVEGYYNATNHLFYEDSTFTNPINGESDTLYVSLDTNLLYRYDGGISIFVRVDEGGQGIQVTTMPLADEYQLNKIYQYIGATDSNYTNGYFYKCTYDGSEYGWTLINVQNSYTKEEIGNLNDLPENTEDVVENISRIKLSIDQLIATKLELGETSTTAYYGDRGKTAYDHSQIIDGTNPHGTTADNVNLKASIVIGGSTRREVEEALTALNSDKISKSSTAGLVKNNGTIDTNVYLTADDITDKADKVSGATNGNFAGLDSSGNLTDSGKRASDFIEKSSVVGLVKNNGTIDTNVYATVSSLSSKADKVVGATGNNFAILDNNGNLADSDISKNVVPSNASSSNKLLVRSDIDDTLSSVSENPVQNKIINTTILGIQDDIDTINDKITGIEDDLNDKQDKLVQGNGITLADSNISVDISYLTSSRLGFIPATEKGTNNGVAELDSSGKVPSSQLPIGLQLGETSSTAYRGDRGKIAYDHSQLTSGNPHNVTATQIGLGNVVNTGDSNTPVSGGVTKFTTGGAYTELNKKANKVSGATNGNFAGLDRNGNLTDSGKKASDFISTSALSGIYTVNDTPEISIDDNDYFPYLDASAGTSGEKRKTLWSNIISKIKAKLATVATSGRYSDLLDTPTVVSSTADGLAPKITNTNSFLKGNGTWAIPTDTKNTAGSTDTSSKIFLIGAASQAANPQTFSDNEVFATNGVLSSKKLTTKALTALAGTGTAGQDKGSGVSPRYIPALWTFNSGITVTNGEVYLIKIPVAGGTYGVWLSLNNGTTYYPVAVGNAKARFATQYAQNTVIAITYESAGVCTCYNKDGGDTLVDITGCFRVLNDYDANTTYLTMSVSELTTGTATTARTVRADYLKTGINSLIDEKIKWTDL